MESIASSAHSSFDSSSKLNSSCQTGEWKTIRIYITSWFKDFDRERELLLKKVLPDLQDWCQSRRLNVIECNLRLGSSKRDRTSSAMVETSLKEIVRYFINESAPFFVNITGEQFGADWPNSLGDSSVYLSPEFRDSQDFSENETELLKLAYRTDNSNAFFVIRNSSSFIGTLPGELQLEFTNSSRVDGNPFPVKLNHVDAAVAVNSIPPSQSLIYPCSYCGMDNVTKRPRFSGSEELICSDVLNFFKTRIASIYPVARPLLVDNPLEEAKLQHEAFMKLAAARVVGRDSFIDELVSSYIEQEGTAGVLIFGHPGTGKSSIMASLADRCQLTSSSMKTPAAHGSSTPSSSEWHVFYHFVGAVPGSTDLLGMLTRLMFELNVLEDAFKRPTNLEEAMAMVRSALSNPSARNCIIIIDAVNQFDDVQDSSAPVAWLPVNLSPAIRLFISVTPESKQYELLRNLLTNWKFIQLQPLARQTKRHIVESQLARFNKQLDGVQMELLLNKRSSDNPMWLSLATEELRAFDLCKEITNKIRSLPDGLLELEEEILARFERETVGPLVVAAVCLLECSVRGLRESEVVDLLAMSDPLPPELAESVAAAQRQMQAFNRQDVDESSLNSALTPASPKSDTDRWEDVYRILRPFIRPFGASDDGRFDFYHRSLSKAVRRRYFSPAPNDTNESEKATAERVFSWFHRRLADYYGDDSCSDLKRRVEEYPIHAWRCGDADGLIRFLSTWEVFDAMYDAEFSRQLSKTWALVFNLLTAKAKSEGSDMNAEANRRPGNLDGIYDKMEKIYENAVSQLMTSGCDEALLIGRLERVARIFMQNGRFEAALKLADNCIQITNNRLNEAVEQDTLAKAATAAIDPNVGDENAPRTIDETPLFEDYTKCSPPVKEAHLCHASFVFLKSEILDEFMRSVDYILKSHLPKILILVQGFEQALAVFRDLAPSDPRFGRGLNRLAFHYAGIAARGGSDTMSAESSKEMAIKRVEEAIDFYTRIGDQPVNLADCYITRGVCEGTANDAQREYYMRGLNLVIEHAGFFHPLLDRAYLNVGIYHEEAGQLDEAYNYFRKWYQLLMTIYGAGHPRAQRSIRILNEDAYRQMALYHGHNVPTITAEMLADGEANEDADEGGNNEMNAPGGPDHI